MKEELGFIYGFIAAVINAAQNKIPVARINGSFQGYGIAWLPTILCGQFPARHETLPVGKKCLFLQRIKHKFRIEFEICPGFNAEIREEIFLVNIDAAKPVAVGDDLHSFHLPDFFLIGNGQRENNGNGVASNQTRG